MCSLKTEDLIAQDKRCHQDNHDMSAPMIGIDMASANALINEALSKFKNVEETNSYPDDSKLLANPKGIIKSFLNQAEATDPIKFDAYRKLCVAHIKEFHNCQKGTNPTCLVCNEAFQHWNTLQRHLQTHVDFRPFSCEICSRTFYSQSKLKRHAVIHNDIKPYKCPVCDRRLGRTEHLKRHLLVHSDNKPYGCSSCAHTTKRLDGIRRHIKRKHGSGAEIISLTSDKSGPQLFRRFSSFLEAGEKDEENVIALGQARNQTKSNEIVDEASLKENFSNGCKEPLTCSMSEDFTKKNGNFAHNSRDHLGDSGSHNENQIDENGTSQIVRHPNNEDFMECKLENGINKDKKFPDWEHGSPLSSQHFLQSLSGTHPNRATQNQSPGTNVNHNAFNKPTFHNQSQGNALYSSATTFPQSDSSESNQSHAFGMSASTILPPSFSTTSVSRHSQTSIPTVSSLSTEMMISQYFQSHQRFGSHVWGFSANPPYSNY